jgi:hypothetical protein
MKVYKNISSIIIGLCLTLSLFSLIPKVAGSIAPIPDQFIDEIYPNCTLSLQLSHTNTVIIFNASDFYNKIGIQFDANYTIYNPDNTTTILLILPFSLAINTSEFIFEVYANNTQIPYELFNSIETQYPFPKTLLRSNVTLFKKNSSIIRYHFSGSINNPLNSRALIYIVYSVGTSLDWIGNTTGRIELRVYGKEPGFAGIGHPPNKDPPQVVDIIGGKSLSSEWNNTKPFRMSVGIQYYREATMFERIMEILGCVLPIFVAISITIITVVVIRRKRKR